MVKAIVRASACGLGTARRPCNERLNRDLPIHQTYLHNIQSLQLGLQEFQKELQNTEGEADSGLSSSQKLKEKHPAAGEGEDVRGVE